MTEQNLHAIILAAGKGTRMNSDLPKVLHNLKDKPLLQYVIETSLEVGASSIEIVVGYKADEVKKFVTQAFPIEVKENTIQFSMQVPQMGTGHAVQVTKGHMQNKDGTFIVLLGDVPLIKKETLLAGSQLLAQHKASAVVLSMKLDNPKGYGRILRDSNNSLIAIREEKDASDSEKEVNEVNSGVFCLKADNLFSLLEELNSNNAQSELYLTDCIEIMHKQGLPTLAHCSEPEWQFQGINNPEQLADLEQHLK